MKRHREDAVLNVLKLAALACGNAPGEDSHSAWIAQSGLLGGYIQVSEGLVMRIGYVKQNPARIRADQT